MEGGLRSAAARFAIALLVVCGCGVGIAASVAGAQSPGGSAPGGPGTTAYMDVARKDCFGTARNTTSKVWFTVADGVLSDVFSPTIENTQREHGAVRRHRRQDVRRPAAARHDLLGQLAGPQRHGVPGHKHGRAVTGFQLVSDYITDPARDSVVVRTTLEPLRGRVRRRSKTLKVYVRYDATIDNTGGGGATNGGPNNATVDPATTALVSSDTNAPTGPFAAQVVGALVANRPFLAESSGFVGTPSDGLEQLDTYHRLVDTTTSSADDGNVVQTARINRLPGRPFTLALGFAPTAQRRDRRRPRERARAVRPDSRALRAGWHAYDDGLTSPRASCRVLGRRERGDAAHLLAVGQRDQGRRGQDEHRRVRRLADRPLGPVRPGDTTHPGWTYREVFARDSYETFTGLLADGDRTSARQMVTLPVRPRPAARWQLPARLRARRLGRARHLRSVRDRRGRLPAADGLGGRVRRRRRPSTAITSAPPRTSSSITDPNYGVERWEEHPGYSPSTIAAEIAGLVAAGHLAAGRRRPGARTPVPRDRRRLPAQRQALDRDHHRPVCASLLHPPVPDRRSQCRRDLRPRQRQL